jgi:two-component system response regulator HydG
MAKAAEAAELNLDLKVLVIDDEPNVAEAVAETLERIGCHCRTATSGREGLERIREGDVDLVLTDLVMGVGDNGGIEIVEETKRYWPDVEVLVFTGHSSVSTAVEAMQKGALAYLEKPLDVDVLRTQVQKAAEKQRLVRESTDLKRQIDKRYSFESIIGRSPAMQRVFDVLGQISATNATVLIQGESGTGKELIARALHNHSPRRARPFVPLNCAALSEGILESELFGHERGAFTGADQMRHGRFEYAQRGTLFLDEVGDMPMTTQIKLLRVIEQREIMRVGSNVPIKVDVRLVAATNQNLEALVREKRFREDLYFRLNVVRINLPPLRDRPDDVPLLIETFLRDFARQHQKNAASIRPAAMEILCSYGWPGNVRELMNCIEAMVVTTKSDVLDLADIPPHISSAPAPARSGMDIPPGMSMDEVEKIYIQRTLELARGNREEAARILKIGERTLYRKLEKYGLK